MVLTTVPWYKDFLQVEYPSYAYSEPESDASNTSLDRYSNGPFSLSLVAD